MSNNLNLHKIAVVTFPLLNLFGRTDILTVLRPFAITYGLLTASYILNNTDQMQKDSGMWTLEKAFLNAFVGKQYLLITLYYLLSKLYFVYLVWKLENKKQAVIFSTVIMTIWVATTDFKKEFNISEKDYDMIFSMGVGLLIWLWDTSI
tara:strand:- start:2859 stop:3305 length:447 start_codon:yes stop_codon:yes gene_type:complete